ncbi:pyridoxamine 5'-phosphate oxidase family protein [Kribbella sp. NBC_00359]|uniref:pyridoxamine 5'-phosphate oxidase family protein n=1 Tax=Kribbella sp. NBC_00359 TaxID=2975966 RepID=UPI002E21DF0C
MTTAQGDLALLQDPIAQELLVSRHPARLAYTWTDGTPRVVPIWFTWTGDELVCGCPPKAPKLRALDAASDVAVTIDDSTSWPYRVLLLRGTATVEMYDDVVPEYEQSANRYLGPEQGAALLSQMRGQPMARVGVRPTWAAVLDFETRFPSALGI